MNSVYLLLVLQCLVREIRGHAATEPLLLYTTLKDVRIANISRSNTKFTILSKNLTVGACIDFHYEQQKICWADHNMESIQCVTHNGSETKNKIEITNGVVSAEGLACDWFTNKLYWTDGDTNRIEVISMDGLHRKILFWTDIDQPRAIALAPMNGLMFWTDWGEIPKIEKASMDGDPKSRSVIVSKNLFWPNGLTIDYDKKLIYWVDAKLNFMEKMTFEGKNRTTILKSKFEYPFALTMYESKLYWTDWKTWSIHFYDQTTKQYEEIIRSPEFVPVDIEVYDQSRQPKGPNPCSKNNGNCSNLCLLSSNPAGYSCACPMGIKMLNQTTCADRPQELLLLARRTEICLVYLDSPDHTYKVLPLNDLKFTIAVDFDPKDEFIYWSDDEVKKIQRARLNGSEQQDVIVSEVYHPDGIAIDWVGRNIYWTDAGTDHVEVCRLETNYRRVIISDKLVDPRGIAVAPNLGWLFWSDWNENAPKVERSNLDGSERIEIVTKDLIWPNGITLDLEKQRIYWCDAKTDKIEHSNMDGSDRQVLISDTLPHAFGFTLMGDFLYWTDWQLRTIDHAHKTSGGQRKLIVENLPDVMGLKAIRITNETWSNLCSYKNGGCSQLCFFRHNQTKICACQLGYELEKDRHTCVKPETFLLYTNGRRIGVIGVENSHNEMEIPMTGIKHASSIDYDTTSMRIYWSDTYLRTINRAFFNGTDPQKVIELGLTTPEDIAIDWLGLNIYWVDSGTHRIEVARLLGSSRRTLLWEGIYDPHSIALDPPNGYMYWSEWGNGHAIKKAAMDGSKARTLISTKGPASGLSLDREKRRIYWIQTNTPAIVSSDLDGNDEKVVVKQSMFNPLGLTLYGDRIFWSEVTGNVFMARKTDGLNREKINQLSENVTDLLMYYPNNQGTNQCATSNGGCSHLCLALPPQSPEDAAQFTCACPTHYTLVDNECVPPKQFMIYSQKNLTVRILPSPTDCLEAVLPIPGLKGVKSIDFDPVDNFLYWIEGKSHSIKKAEVSGTETWVVVQDKNETQPYDLAVDSLGRLLFWTCATRNVINVTRLDNNNPFGIVVNQKDEQPRLLVIHPTKRLLFYTDVGNARQLVRTRLDGSHRLVITKNADISAIAVDPENDRIFWVQNNTIYISNIEGENKETLPIQHRVTQLTVLSGWLYWIDRVSSLQRLELFSLKHGDPLSLQASHIVDMISVTKLDRNHSCFQPHQKKCTHLCILNGTNPLCACPVGHALKEDKKTCEPLLNCGPDRFGCSATHIENNNCIPLQWKCDGQQDCQDGSDELSCTNCLPNQFRCRDGRCINLANVCDGIAHCSDKSDEDNCCKDGFQCPNTQLCLPLSVVCDKIDNCADGSDEDHVRCASVAKQSAAFDNWMMIIIIAFSSILMVLGAAFYCLYKKIKTDEDNRDQSEDSLSPMHPKPYVKGQKIRRGIPDLVRMSMLTGSESSSYDRNHITGASSSTNGSSLTSYPREPLNPPPSPATTRGSSPSSRYRPYRHYRSINQPPPPTPCSTDVCDESDYNYPTRRYDGGSFPPPPTPRSHCQSESCPPSPSSRSSTYFNPLPPPPSPVASPPRGYSS